MAEYTLQAAPVVRDEKGKPKTGKVVTALGTFHYKNGRYHRTTGPACEYADGSFGYYLNGLLHRANGPALEYPTGYKAWFLKGIFQKDFSPSATSQKIVFRVCHCGKKPNVFTSENQCSAHLPRIDYAQEQLIIDEFELNEA